MGSTQLWRLWLIPLINCNSAGVEVGTYFLSHHVFVCNFAQVEWEKQNTGITLLKYSINHWVWFRLFLIKELKPKKQTKNACIHLYTRRLLTPIWQHYRTWQWPFLNLQSSHYNKRWKFILVLAPWLRFKGRGGVNSESAKVKQVVRVRNLCHCSRRDFCLQENLLALLIKHPRSVLGLVVVQS